MLVCYICDLLIVDLGFFFAGVGVLFLLVAIYSQFTLLFYLSKVF